MAVALRVASEVLALQSLLRPHLQITISAIPGSLARTTIDTATPFPALHDVFDLIDRQESQYRKRRAEHIGTNILEHLRRLDLHCCQDCCGTAYRISFPTCHTLFWLEGLHNLWKSAPGSSTPKHGNTARCIAAGTLNNTYQHAG